MPHSSVQCKFHEKWTSRTEDTLQQIKAIVLKAVQTLLYYRKAEVLQYFKCENTPTEVRATTIGLLLLFFFRQYVGLKLRYL